jgi:hypothetical protein
MCFCVVEQKKGSWSSMVCEFMSTLDMMRSESSLCSLVSFCAGVVRCTCECE